MIARFAFLVDELGCLAEDVVELKAGSGYRNVSGVPGSSGLAVLSPAIVSIVNVLQVLSLFILKLVGGE